MLKELMGVDNFLKLNVGLDEMAYWKAIGGTGSTINDIMVSALKVQGFATGTVKDNLYAFLQFNKQGNTSGTLTDLAKGFTGVVG